MKLYYRKNCKGDYTTIHPVTEVAPNGKVNNFADDSLLSNIRDDMRSLEWHLPPGVVVIFYEDASAGGDQLVIFGRGCMSQLHGSIDKKVSRWAWYYVGGVHDETPVSSQIERPAGTNPLPIALTDTVQVWEDTDCRGRLEPLGIRHHAALKSHSLPKGVRGKGSSLRWCLPDGVVVVLHRDGGPQVGIWGQGEMAKLSRWDFNDMATEWIWYDVGTAESKLPKSCPDCMRPREAGENFCPVCRLDWQCPECEMDRQRDANYCSNCGYEWTQGVPSLRCPCGTPRPADDPWTYCKDCGKRWNR